MPDVKPHGRPSLRAERAEVTRRRIVDAARAVFARQGYGATTLTAVAAEAGVAVQTVYAVYGSKAGILRALRASVRDQPGADARFMDALRAATALEALDAFADSIRRRWEFGHDIVAIDLEAASTDPTLRQELDEILGFRRAGIARLADSISDELALDLDPAHAAAIIDALTLPSVYATLVDVQGWSPDAFEVWLGISLKRQLL